MREITAGGSVAAGREQIKHRLWWIIGEKPEKNQLSRRKQEHTDALQTRLQSRGWQTFWWTLAQ